MKKNKINFGIKKIFISLAIIFSVFAVSNIPCVYSVPTALAQTTTSATDLNSGGSGLTIPENNVQISSAISKKSFTDNVLAIVNYFLGFIGFLATLAFIYAGVLWVLSGGNEDSVGKARKIMTYAALGIVVIILSFSAVRFITNAVPGTGTVTGSGGTTYDTPDPTGNGDCRSDNDCDSGETCLKNISTGLNVCVSTDSTSQCYTDADCSSGSYCNTSTQKCELGRGSGSDTSTGSNPTYSDPISVIDEGIDGLDDDLSTGGLSSGAKPTVDNILSGSTGSGATKGIDGLKTKSDQLEELLKDPVKNNLTDDDIKIIETIINALDRLRILRDELDQLKDEMPDALMDDYDAASVTLDDLIDDPSSTVKYNRFDTKYKALKQKLSTFPVVRAVIWATPSAGNVPFTVQLDGLDSSDPSGGTINDYRWTYTDASGNDVSLGSQPVVIHDFTDVGTYSVHLRVSTSQRNDKGFKTAADGEAVIRIKANPPTSQVKFRINGREAGDIYNVTYKEAQAGLSFDPGGTTAALGRKIVKYDWNFGDNNVDSRTLPTAIVHTYEKPGEYMVKLSVTDNIGVVDKRIIKLNVKSIAADIIVSPTSGDVNTTFTFQGVTSRSDVGNIRSYDWEINDSEGNLIKQSNQNIFSYKFNKPGTYSIVITVTDVTGAQDRYTRAVTVNSRPPVANFTFSMPEKNHPNKVEFNAIDSYDPDEGDKIKYSWDFDGDGKFDIISGSDYIVTHEYNKTGDYKVKLQVEDSYGQYSQSEEKLSIESVLSGDIVSVKRAVSIGEPIDFEIKSPNAVAYLWEFGDGETQSTEDTKVTHTYNKVGKFSVKVNFFDSDDNSNYATQTILVGAGEKPVAVIDFTVNGRSPRTIEDLCGDKSGTVVSRADTIRFDARNSINTDGSSRLLSYDWRLPGGEIGSDKDTNFKFDEINKEGECFSTSLVVRDQLSGKLSESDEVYFKVTNEFPQITDFVVTPPDAEPLVTPAKVSLKVINPKDNDGTIKKYRWWYSREGFSNEKLGLNSTTVPQTDITITSFGEQEATNRYYFTVEVIDNDNGSYLSTDRFGAVSYVDIQNGPNLSPVVDFVMDKSTINVGDSITFISRSYDPQGEQLTNDAFRWDFDGDGQFDDTTSGPQVSRQYNTPGEYSVRLRVVNRGLSSSATKTVNVETSQALPQAAFTYMISGNQVTFDASHSRFDPSLNDTTLRYEWDFNVNADDNGNGINDDDVQSTDMKPVYTYNEKGVYKVKLKIKQSDGSEGVVVRDVNLNQTQQERDSNSYHSVQVSSQKYPMTTLNIDVVPYNLAKGDSADINAVILNADGSLYNGKVFFEIVNGSGEFTPNPVMAIDSKASSVFSATDTGKTRIRVRATGTIYGELTEEMTINVK